MPFIKLDHAVVAVSDWSRSNAFYRDVLGAELVPVGNGTVPGSTEGSSRACR